MFVSNASMCVSGGDLEPPTAVLWVYHFLAQHFDHLRDSKKAMEYIDKALEHTPTLIEAYMVKARIYKVMKTGLLTMCDITEVSSAGCTNVYVRTQAGRCFSINPTL